MRRAAPPAAGGRDSVVWTGHADGYIYVHHGRSLNVDRCGAAAAAGTMCAFYPRERRPGAGPLGTQPQAAAAMHVCTRGGGAPAHADAGPRRWQLPSTPAPVRALAVDPEGQAWAGSDAGQLVVLQFDLRTRRISYR
jgi:hypothetical protein